MLSYDINACLGDITCELSYHQLAILNDLKTLLTQLDIVGKYLFIGFCGIIAVVFIWNVLKSIF